MINEYILDKLKRLEIINDFTYVESKDVFIVKFSDKGHWQTIDNKISEKNTISLFVGLYEEFLEYDNGLSYLLDNKIFKDFLFKDNLITFSLKAIDDDIFGCKYIIGNPSILFKDNNFVCKKTLVTISSFIKKIIDYYSK